MKNRFFLLLVTAVVVFVTACDFLVMTPDEATHDDFVPTGGSGPIQLKAALLPQAARDNAFALNLFRAMASSSSDSNIVISPMSISIALGMAWNGAAAETKAEMTALLGMSETPDSLINQYYEVMQKSLPVIDSSTTVNIANSLWYTTDFTVKPSYLNVNQTYFDAEVRSIDFKQTWAKDTINAWVDAKTNHLIPDIVKSTQDQVMYLINAVYFKGAWVKPFSPQQTSKSYFAKEKGGLNEVMMMWKLDTLQYGATENAEYINLPYGNGAYSMTLVLPKYGHSTSSVLAALTPKSLDQTIQTMIAQKVQLAMPRFKVECDFALVPVLRSLGMRLAFTDMADFSGISSENVFISEVRHKTYVEVTEEGTKAAAVTSIGFATTMMPNYPVVSFNKPFLFFIRENGSKVILFAGKIANVELF